MGDAGATPLLLLRLVGELIIIMTRESGILPPKGVGNSGNTSKYLTLRFK